MFVSNCPFRKDTQTSCLNNHMILIWCLDTSHFMLFFNFFPYSLFIHYFFFFTDSFIFTYDFSKRFNSSHDYFFTWILHDSFIFKWLLYHSVIFTWFFPMNHLFFTFFSTVIHLLSCVCFHLIFTINKFFTSRIFHDEFHIWFFDSHNSFIFTWLLHDSFIFHSLILFIFTFFPPHGSFFTFDSLHHFIYLHL